MSFDPVDAISERRIHCWTPLGVDRLQLFELKGRERLSGLFRFRLRFRAEVLDPIAIERLIDAPVQVAFQLPDPDWLLAGEAPDVLATRDFCGLLTSMTIDGEDDMYRYFTAVMRPHLWRFSQNVRYRAFSQQTTQQVVTQVLRDLPVRWALTRPSKPRNYCVQYGESDFAFLSRLLEEDGLFYFFEHQYEEQPSDRSERTERLVISDRIEQVNPQPAPAYAYDPVRGGNRGMMRIRRWTESHAAGPARAVSLDRHFQRPGSLVVGSKVAVPGPEDSSGPSAEESDAATVTKYPSGVARRIDGISPTGDEQEDRLATLTADAEADATVQGERLAFATTSYRGAGDVATMRPAAHFRLLRGSLPDPQPYYTVAIEHLVRLSTSRRSQQQSPRLQYKNRFRCQTVDVPYRPAQTTPKPVIAGTVPAEVVADAATSEDQVCIDRFGRIKLVFPWQTEPRAPSCWVRVSQVWAGPRWGAFFWPRVGHEVLVAFEYGDPDRPVVVGSLYNGNNLPPLELPKHKLSGGIHSCSHHGNPLHNTNCVVFHDQQGDEYLQLHSETFECLSSETKKLNWSAGEEISVKGHHWLFGSGSGGGGGFKDDSDMLFKEDHGSVGEDVGFGVLELLRLITATGTRGNIDLITGDSDKKVLGRTIASFFGSKINLSCDPLDLLEWACPFPPVSFPLLFGATGQGSTTLGSAHKIHFGTEVKTQRGYELKSAKNDVRERKPALRFGAGNAKPTDAPAMTASEVAVALEFLTDFAVLVFTKIALAHSDNEHWRGFLTCSEVWSLCLLPRVQGLIEFVETTVAEIDDANPVVDDAVDKSTTSLTRVSRAATVTDSGASETRESVAEEIASTEDAVESAEPRVARVAAEAADGAEATASAASAAPAAEAAEAPAAAEASGAAAASS